MPKPGQHAAMEPDHLKCYILQYVHKLVRLCCRGGLPYQGSDCLSDQLLYRFRVPHTFKQEVHGVLNLAT
jgi:hypothetical protein